MAMMRSTHTSGVTNIPPGSGSVGGMSQQEVSICLCQPAESLLAPCRQREKAVDFFIVLRMYFITHRGIGREDGVSIRTSECKGRYPSNPQRGHGRSFFFLRPRHAGLRDCYMKIVK